MKQLLVFLLLTLMLFGCKDSDQIKLQDGTYTGSFTVNYPDHDPVTNDVTITINGSHYTCSSGPGRMPAGGSGIFTISEHTITFSDENIWTAEFDWGLILTGDYQVHESGSNLLIERTLNARTIYSYKIARN